MKIKIDSKTFEKNSLKIIDSVDHLPRKEWIYFTEALYLAPSGEFILETMWQLNQIYYENELTDGTMKEKDFEPHIEYMILSDEEATEWQEAVVWEV